MIPNITRYLNKTIFVAIPAVFDDARLPAVDVIGR